MNGNPASAPTHQTAFHVMVKPIGPVCNLRCKYCFYLEKHALFPDKEDYRMSDEVLRAFIGKYIQSQTTPEITFAWQGGEPTLLGVDFFRKVVAIQREFANGRPVNNSLQTNGTRLNDEWCQFLAHAKFLVGLSIDGPEDIHKRYRVYPDGRSSFSDVLRGLRYLKKHGVEFNTLTCVTRESAYAGRQVYRFLKNQGAVFMQFIPIVERPADAEALKLGLDLATPPDLHHAADASEATPFSVEPRQYGQFLVDIFDEWVKKDVGRCFVNHFDVALNTWLGLEAPLCSNARQCGKGLAMEHDGGIYACDHYVYPEYRLGSAMDTPFDQLVFHPRQWRFGLEKQSTLPRQCRECPFLFACNGGCPKHRFLKTADGEPGLNYLCEGFKLFYSHIDEPMRRMAELLHAGRPADEIMNTRR